MSDNEQVLSSKAVPFLRASAVEHLVLPQAYVSDSGGLQ